MTWEQNGTVIASEGGLYEIYTDGGERIQCKPRGRFRHEKKKLLVGDRILVSADEAGNKWVDEILERKNRLLRPPMANVTHLFLLISTALRKCRQADRHCRRKPDRDTDRGEQMRSFL